MYVAVNGAEPKFEFKGIGVSDAAGKRQAVITMSNTGDAHGRLEGTLSATDANGRKFELVPDSSPVMPGQTRTLVLQARTSQQVRAIEPAFPLKSEGQLDWDLGSFKVDVEFR